MNKTVVKILLEHGHYITFVLPRAEGDQLVKDWANGRLQGKCITQTCQQTGAIAAVQINRVVSMHTMPTTQEELEKIARQQQQSSQQNWGSGYPN